MARCGMVGQRETESGSGGHSGIEEVTKAGKLRRAADRFQVLDHHHVGRGHAVSQPFPPIRRDRPLKLCTKPDSIDQEDRQPPGGRPTGQFMEQRRMPGGRDETQRARERRRRRIEERLKRPANLLTTVPGRAERRRVAGPRNKKSGAPRSRISRPGIERPEFRGSCHVMSHGVGTCLRSNWLVRLASVPVHPSSTRRDRRQPTSGAEGKEAVSDASGKGRP